VPSLTVFLATAGSATAGGVPSLTVFLATAGSATAGGVPSMTVFLRAFWQAAAVVVRIRALWHADPGGIPVPRFVVLL